ncbi:MAG: LLM class flavin-dependent oxidoreductase [Abitibacteriaceae bacterium]|nr:LLM class flavin-dependent oxidoreductase [Abditibacteriaceae bacterium]
MTATETNVEPQRERAKIPFSVLDLAPITLDSTPTQAFHNSLDLARHAEAWGYHRFWLAEHHNMPGIASAATSVVIGYVAGGTSTIRVGAGGVMLPNHSPLVIAEQFGTLESLYPGRIDLGLGRAPGTDQITARALRRDMAGGADTFPQDVLELQNYFRSADPAQQVRAVPGQGLNVPLWLLGSSLFSAQLAAMLGLPFAFASHFAPEHMNLALELYRTRLQPSETLQRPYVMLGLNVFAAEADAEAKRLFTSLQQQFVNLRRGRPGPLPPPLENLEGFMTPHEQAGIEHALACSAIGSPEIVRQGIIDFIASTKPDELMVTAQIFEHEARLRSFQIVAAIRDSLASS